MRGKWSVIFYLTLTVFTGLAGSPGEENRRAIVKVIEAQQACWNQGDLECYMAGYQKSDDLVFIGSSGITRGWQQTLDRYKKSYPDQETMGRLTLKILAMEPMGATAMFVIGTWHLDRKTGDDPEGFFSLVWKKIDGSWLIVADHSS